MKPRVCEGWHARLLDDTPQRSCTSPQTRREEVDKGQQWRKHYFLCGCCWFLTIALCFTPPPTHTQCQHRKQPSLLLIARMWPCPLSNHSVKSQTPPLICPPGSRLCWWHSSSSSLWWRGTGSAISAPNIAWPPQKTTRAHAQQTHSLQWLPGLPNPLIRSIFPSGQWSSRTQTHQRHTAALPVCARDAERADKVPVACFVSVSVCRVGYVYRHKMSFSFDTHEQHCGLDTQTDTNAEHGTTLLRQNPKNII